MIQTAPTLSLEGVSLRWGTRWVVSGLNLQVHSGQILGFLGPNGSGKSTTLAAISSQKPVDAGSIRIGGVSYQDAPELYRQRIGYVPQDLAYYEEMSARDNLMFFGRMFGLHGRALRERVMDALDFVQLLNQADRKPNAFSGGMQRRLNLACSLLHDPLLLLLDEPTVGLDVSSREAIYDLLGQLRKRGRAIVLTTHLLEEAATLCDQIAILNQGKLMAHGSLEEVCTHLSPRGLGYFAAGAEPASIPFTPRRFEASAGAEEQQPVPNALARMIANLAAQGAAHRKATAPRVDPIETVAGSTLGKAA